MSSIPPTPPAGALPARASIHRGREVWYALRRRWWLALGTPVALTLLALMFLFMVRPTFEASSSLRYLEEEGPLGGLAGALGGGEGGMSLLSSLTGRSIPIQTEISVLRSRNLADSVIHTLGLRMEIKEPARVTRSTLFREVVTTRQAESGKYTLDRTGGDAFSVRGEVVVGRDPFRVLFNESIEERDLGSVRVGDALPIAGTRVVLAPGAAEEDRIVFRILPEEDALERFTEAVAVTRPERDADMVSIEATWTDPELSADIPNLLARLYVEQRNRLATADLGKTATFLEEQIDSLRGELGNAEESLRDYREVEGIVEPTAQAEAAIEQLAELQARRDLLGIERRALGSLMGEVKAEVAAGGSERSGPEGSPLRRLVFFPTLLQNAATAEMIGLLGELENQRGELLDRRTADAGEVQALDRRINDLEQQLRVVAETYLAGLGNQVSNLDDRLADFSGQLSRMPGVELEYLRRRRQVELLTEVYAFMQVRQKEVEVTAAGTVGGVRVVDRAEPPIEPVSPRPAITLLVALVLGSVIGVILALVADQAVWTDPDPEPGLPG